MERTKYLFKNRHVELCLDRDWAAHDGGFLGDHHSAEKDWLGADPVVDPTNEAPSQPSCGIGLSKRPKFTRSYRIGSDDTHLAENGPANGELGALLCLTTPPILPLVQCWSKSIPPYIYR